MDLLFIKGSGPFISKNFTVENYIITGEIKTLLNSVNDDAIS